MSIEDDNIAAQQAFGEAVNSGNLDALDELITADSVDHDPSPGQGIGPAGYKAMFTEMRAAFPDLHVEVAHLTASGDDVAFAYTLTGTHQGIFQGHAPTGKSFSVRGMQISVFTAGKMSERWGSSDEKGIAEQLQLV